MWDGHCIRILYVGWPLHIILCMGRRPYIYIYACIPGISCEGWPLHKDSLCGEAIEYYSLYGQAICIYIYTLCVQGISFRGGHYIRILYVGRPLNIILYMGRPYVYIYIMCTRDLFQGWSLHKDSLCGVAIA